nr:SusC/RagA family protein [Hydrotalea flava]NIM37935.1 SusC/RagA family protein [Hydrotalea flava]NIN03104.1 SusC/RagA family protein [Hydrotalea flava]NIN14789.1 SusC/RagA family protein [Hydrotalea flava]NIO93861.1 SusC/RagA family protein [Hydrotalea flava]
ANLGNYLYNNVASSTGTMKNILNPLGYLSNGSSDVLNTNFTGNGTNYYLSDYYVQNASFLRMDNIFIGYNFGKVFKNTVGLRLGASVQNVFVITDYKGADPEINYQGTYPQTYSGIDNSLYIRPRTFVLNLNLDF